MSSWRFHWINNRLCQPSGSFVGGIWEKVMAASIFLYLPRVYSDITRTKIGIDRSKSLIMYLALFDWSKLKLRMQSIDASCVTCQKVIASFRALFISKIHDGLAYYLWWSTLYSRKYKVWHEQRPAKSSPSRPSQPGAAWPAEEEKDKKHVFVFKEASTIHLNINAQIPSSVSF